MNSPAPFVDGPAPPKPTPAQTQATKKLPPPPVKVVNLPVAGLQDPIKKPTPKKDEEEVAGYKIQEDKLEFDDSSIKHDQAGGNP